MKKNQMPKLDEKRDLHPLVQTELESHGYHVQHEVKLDRGKVDFIARRGNSENDEVLVIEVKRDCKNIAEVCGQVLGYAFQVASGQPAIFVPEEMRSDEAMSVCDRFGVMLIPIHIPNKVYDLAYRTARPDIRDDRPLPLIVAERWGFSLQHCFRNDGYRYALQDWVVGMTHISGDALRKQLERLKPVVMTVVTTESYVASDGKTYKIPFVTDEGLYAAAQAIKPINRAIPLPPAHGEILRFLAKAGVLVDVYRRNPERMRRDAEQLIAQRGETIDESYVRKELTDAINELTGGKCGLYIAEFTNIINEGVLQKTASQQRSALDLARAKNPRDHMYPPGRMVIAIAEYMAADELRKRQPGTLDEIRDILRATAAAVGLGAQVIQSGTDTDLVTGRALPPYRALEDET